MKHVVHHVLHIGYCLAGCILFHFLDYYFEITRFCFKLVGIGF